MIDHVTIRVSHLAQSKSFYEKAFSPLGFKLSFGEEGVFWAFDIGSGCLFEIAQFSGEGPLTPVHIAFRARSQEKVREFYRAALDAGALDNGQPGPRPQYSKNYYACFIRDPDGHNIESVLDIWP